MSYTNYDSTFQCTGVYNKRPVRCIMPAGLLLCLTRRVNNVSDFMMLLLQQEAEYRRIHECCVQQREQLAEQRTQ